MSGNLAPAQPNLWPYILPTVIVLGAMTLYPVGHVLWMSLNDWTWGGDASFSGLQNYKLLWLKGSFLIALVNTVLDPSALKHMTGDDRKNVTPQVRRANLEKAAFQVPR